MTENTGKKISEELKNDFTMDKLWAVLCLMQGERFYTARGLEFHYKIRGNEIFVDRKVNSKSITRSSVEMVFRKLQERRQGKQQKARSMWESFSRKQGLGGIPSTTWPWKA